MFNYATKSDLKTVIVVEKFKIFYKTGLANIKSDIDKLDIDKLEKLPSGLSNLKKKVDK